MSQEKAAPGESSEPTASVASGETTESTAVRSSEKPEGTLKDEADAKRELITVERGIILLGAVLGVLGYFVPESYVNGTANRLFLTFAVCFLTLIIVRIINFFRSGPTSKIYPVDLGITIVFVFCATAVLFGSIQPFSHPASHETGPGVSDFAVDFPKVAAGSQSPAAIGCPQTFSGTAQISSGYVVVFGSRFINSRTWVFHKATMDGDGWHADNVHIVQNPTSGRLVYLIAAVVKDTSAEYYLNSYQQAIAINGGPTGSWWDSTQMPPDTIGRTSPLLAELPEPDKVDQISSCWDAKSPGSSDAAQIANAAKALGTHVTPASNAQIGTCTRVSGAGIIPPGYQVWVANLYDISGEPDTSNYFNLQQATVNGNTWSTAAFSVGRPNVDTGKNFWIFVYLIPDTESLILGDVTTTSSYSLSLKKVVNGAYLISRIPVERDAAKTC